MFDAAAFRSDGYTVVRGQLDQGRIAAVAAHVAQVVETLAEQTGSGPLPHRLIEVLNGRPLPPRHFDALLHSAPVCRLLQDRALTETLAALLGPEVTYQGNGHLRAHLPGPLDPVPWHQDVQFYGAGTELMADCMAQVWLPLVDAPVESGCLAVVPGSHNWGLLPNAVPGTENVAPSTAERQDMIYRANGERVASASAQVRELPMRLGDFVMFHPLLLHTGLPNRSNAVRWSMDVRFEATLGTRPLTEQQQRGYATMHRRLDARGYVPLRVHSASAEVDDWATWQRRAATR